MECWSDNVYSIKIFMCNRLIKLIHQKGCNSFINMNIPHIENIKSKYIKTNENNIPYNIMKINLN